MGDKTKIEWTDASWNPIRARWTDAEGNVRTGWYCTHMSEGCRNCYSEGMNARFGTTLPYKPGHLKDVEIFLDEVLLIQPLRWRRARKIFVCSMTDLFGDFVPADLVDRMMAVMALCPQHTFQILTKRPDRMRDHLAADDIEDRINDAAHQLPGSLNETWTYPAQWPMPNVWLGTSVEDQGTADLRIPALLQAPAAKRFLSCEPLLGPISLEEIPCLAGTGETVLSPECWGDCGCDTAFGPDPGCRRNGGDGTLMRRIDWVIVGGESGRAARPMHPDWARSLRDQCAEAGTAFLFKQWGEWWEVDSAARDDDGNHHQVDVESAMAWEMFDPKTDCAIALDGQVFRDLALIPSDVPCRHMTRLGKAIAGRELDGVIHDGFPA